MLLLSCWLPDRVAAAAAVAGSIADVGALESTTASWAPLLCCGSNLCKEVVDGTRLDWLGWLGWLYAGWPLLLLSCRSPDRVAVAVAGSISDVGALVSALVSALVVERTLLVHAAAPLGFNLGDVVQFVCVDSCPGKRVGINSSR